TTYKKLLITWAPLNCVPIRSLPFFDPVSTLPCSLPKCSKFKGYSFRQVVLTINASLPLLVGEAQDGVPTPTASSPLAAPASCPVLFAGTWRAWPAGTGSPHPCR